MPARRRVSAHPRPRNGPRVERTPTAEASVRNVFTELDQHEAAATDRPVLAVLTYLRTVRVCRACRLCYRPGTAAGSGTTSPNRSLIAARLTSWTVAAGTTPDGPGRSRVAVAEATTVGRYPRLKAPRAVEFTHMCVMKPARRTLWHHAAARMSWRSVPTKAFGRSFTITVSPFLGATRSTMAPMSARTSYGDPGPAS